MELGRLWRRPTSLSLHYVLVMDTDNVASRHTSSAGPFRTHIHRPARPAASRRTLHHAAERGPLRRHPCRSRRSCWSPATPTKASTTARHASKTLFSELPQLCQALFIDGRALDLAADRHDLDYFLPRVQLGSNNHKPIEQIYRDTVRRRYSRPSHLLNKDSASFNYSSLPKHRQYVLNAQERDHLLQWRHSSERMLKEEEAYVELCSFTG